MNLVVNAFDAMPGGGELILSTKKEYTASLPGNYITIEKGEYVIIGVKDTGMGMASEDIERIFEPYYSKKKMGTSGSGLGMSVVYGIISDHKGYYDIKSKVNKGTEFLFYFPAISDNKVVKNKEFDCSGNEKILIVDDDNDARELAKAVIASYGYFVETANNGRDALNKLKADNFDLIVIDMIMDPDFDGLDTYRELIKINTAQKVIIISGYSATARVKTMQELGAGQYIKKPFTRETLGRAVRSELDKKQKDKS
jgi:CheY-like chemotaxis protein